MESNMELMVLKLRKLHFQFQNHHKIKPQASKTYNWTQNQNEKIPELKQQKQLKTTKGKSFTVFSSGRNFSCPQIWKNRRYKEKRVERTQCVQILDLNSCFSTSSVLNKEAKLSVRLWSVVMSPEAHCWSVLTFNGKEPTSQCRRYKRPRFNCWVGKIPQKRKWQPTPVFLPGESYRQRSLAGYSPSGRKESDTTEWLGTHTHKYNLSQTTLKGWPLSRWENRPEESKLEPSRKPGTLDLDLLFPSMLFLPAFASLVLWKALESLGVKLWLYGVILSAVGFHFGFIFGPFCLHFTHYHTALWGCWYCLSFFLSSGFDSVLHGPVFPRQNILVLPIRVLVVLKSTWKKKERERNSLIKKNLIYVSFFNVIMEKILWLVIH